MPRWSTSTSRSFMSALAEPPESAPEWKDDDLLGTLHDYFGAGSDAGLPDEVRFLVNVATLVEKQLDREAPPQTPAVFLLFPTFKDLVPETREVPMLDNGMTELGSAIWFVGPVFGQARQYTIPEWEDTEVFKLLEEWDNASVAAVFMETR